LYLDLLNAVLQVNVLYVHGPDYETPFVEQAAAFDAQYRAGKFVSLGIGNCKLDYVSNYLDAAMENNYLKPTVCSGQYNVLCRGYDTTLFPLLRKHSMSFVGYSPLTGGFLTGKLTFSKSEQDLKGTRFENDASNYMGAAYKHWYDHQEMHDAVKKMEGHWGDDGGCGLEMGAVSFRA
jgi:aflatoxin B1 aldehyde reductase